MTLTTPAEFIHAIQAHDIEPAVFCTHLLHTATSGDGTVTPADTADEFGIDTGAASRLHRLASEFSLVNYNGTTSNRIEVNRRMTMDFIEFADAFVEYATQEEIELLANDAIHDVDLNVAVPEDFDGRSADLMARLTRLVRNAEKELLVVTPFFTRFGVDAFVDHLAQATNRGVLVTILTRDVNDEGENAEYITRIRETVEESGTSSNLRIYEYNPEEGRLHAKALIADNREAYVGSANLTTYSLREAIEIGLIVRGPVVQELADFFSTVRTSTDTRRI